MGYLADYLEEMRAGGDDQRADEIEDAADHDHHDAAHDDEFVMTCWFCWEESQRPGLGWPFDGPPPERKIEQ